MLKLTISLDDAGGPWTCADGTWHCGTSVIEPVTHPALETVVSAPDGALRVTIRERCPGRNDEPRLDDWPGDFITVELGPRTVRLHAGLRGVAPLYLAADDGTLRGSWDLASLRGSVSADRLVNREVARLLTMRFRYGHDTLFADTRKLTERSDAVFTDKGLKLRYPHAAKHSKARELRREANVVAAYERPLGAAISARSHDPASACVELSGGLDSANVAASLGSLHPNQMAASAMLLLGDTGAQQTARRAELITLLSLGADVPVSFSGQLPLSPAGRRGSGIPVTPYEDPCDEAKTELLARLAECGVRTVFTGVGGDEMVARTIAESPHPPLGAGAERMPWISMQTFDIAEECDNGTAPATVVNEMTLTAQACAAPRSFGQGYGPCTHSRTLT